MRDANHPYLLPEPNTSLGYITIACVSFAALTFELLLTRILSFIFWNHVVYLAISVALLGFAISGTVVTILLRRNIEPARLIALCTALMSASMLLALVIMSWGLSALGSSSSAFKLMLSYFACVPPFVFAGAALSLLFAYSRERAGALYFCDLLAAAAGCALFFVLLPALGAVLAVCALAGLVAICSTAWLRYTGPSRRRMHTALVSTAFAGVCVAAIFHSGLDFRPENYKELAAMLHAGGRIENTRWTALARIDVVGGAPNHHLVDYSEHPAGSYKIITQDGSAHTRLPGSRAIDDLRARVNSGTSVYPSTIPYSILRNPDVAIIGTGGGIDVAYALTNNAGSVFAVELNPFTYEVAKHKYADFNGGLLHDPRVHAINAEGRHAIRSSDKKFDLIQIIAIDTFAALNAGAYVLSENYLYTVEAFQDYFAHLKPNGMLALYRWNSIPPRESLRLTSLAAEAWRRAGVKNISERIMVVGNEPWALSIFKNGPFTAAEVNTIAERARRSGRMVLYWPKILPEPEQSAMEAAYYANPGSLRGESGEAVNPEAARRFAQQSSSVYNALVHAFETNTDQAFFRSYPYKVTPTTDDSPFFFESTSLSEPRNWTLNTLRGSSVQSTLLQITIAATIAMILAVLVPLFVFHREGMRVHRARSYTLYFAALGFGFMVLEVSLMQKCILVLGNPMYAVPVVLAGLLLSAGAGSAISARWNASLLVKTIVGTGILIVTILAFLLTFHAAAGMLLTQPFGIRVLAVLVEIFPTGVALGMFFPAGLQHVRDQAPAYVPWAWGINGAASVYGSIAATIAAMSLGFNLVLVLGVCAYLLALAASRFIAAPVPSVDEVSELATEARDAA